MNLTSQFIFILSSIHFLESKYNQHSGVHGHGTAIQPIQNTDYYTLSKRGIRQPMTAMHDSLRETLLRDVDGR